MARLINGLIHLHCDRTIRNHLRPICICRDATKVAGTEYISGFKYANEPRRLSGYFSDETLEDVC